MTSNYKQGGAAVLSFNFQFEQSKFPGTFRSDYLETVDGTLLDLNELLHENALDRGGFLNSTVAHVSSGCGFLRGARVATAAQYY